MNADFDLLRERWARAGARIDANLMLDVEAVRRALSARTARAARSQGFWLTLELAMDAVLTLALAAFAVAYRGDPLYLGCSLALLSVPLASFVVGARQWLALRRLDYAMPVLHLRAHFDALRRRRVHLARYILFTAVPLWWPALAVLMMALSGGRFDLLRRLPASFHIINLMLGLMVILITMLVGGWIAKRYGARAGYQDWLDDLAGLGWRGLRRRLDAQARFEHDLEAEGEAAALRTHRPGAALPPAAAQALRALRRRLLLVIFVNAGLIVLTGLFNATHGGQAQFIVPGVLTNFAWIAQMVAAILQRTTLGHLDPAQPPAQYARRVAELAAWGRRVAQRLVTLAPMLGLLLAQVLAQAIAGVDLLALTDWRTTLALAAIATLASIGLYRRFRGDPEGFAAPVADAMSLGAAAHARRLAAALDAATS